MSEGTEDVGIPSIYVSKAALRASTAVTPAEAKEYIVNGQSFLEGTYRTFPKTRKEVLSFEGAEDLLQENTEVFDEVMTEDSCLAEFEVYDMDVDEGDMYCSTPESESEYGEDNEVKLKVTLQSAPNGYILNGSSFLTWQQWNTLVTPAVTLKLLHCVVCSQYCEATSSADHVATTNHRSALQAYPPLQKYDLSITRKIRNQYHCAVCNEVFDYASEPDHFGGKMHEGNLLFSINKASDLLDNSFENNNTNKNKNDTYHFKTHAMDTTINSSFNDSASVDSDNFNYRDNNQFINFQNNYYFDEYEEEAPVFTGKSYASMARKPKENTEKFLEIDFGSKKVKVNHDSWHMIIIPEQTNRFWCMVCKKFDHIRTKKDHTTDVNHLNNLDKCKVVKSYEEYFIRQVDDKLYHCGHCNNLQLIHEMEDHIESYHPRRTRLVTETKYVTNSPVKNSPVKNVPVKSDHSPQNAKDKSGAGKDNDANKNTIDSPRKVTANLVKNTNVKVNNNNINKNIYNKTMTDQNGATSANVGITHKMPGIFDNIVIFPFGYKITVSSLAYNIVCQRPKDFYCGLCDFVCEESVMAQHIYEVRHLELLQRTPFIAPFSWNLIRAIRDALHCAICNIPLSAAVIYAHIKEPQHLGLLNNALSQDPKPKLPPIGVKIPNIPNPPTLEAAPVLSSNKAPNNANGFNHTINNAYNAKEVDNDEVVTNNIERPIKQDISNEAENTQTYRIDTETLVTEDAEDMSDTVQDENEDDFEETMSDEELNRTLDSITSEDATFDGEEHVYLKLKNSYIKISNTSYNTLVHIGDGSRYCFVCSVQVLYAELQKHVDGRLHIDNMEKYRFLDKYEDHLLRQFYLKYHCAICNVIVLRKELKSHLEWPTHALQIINLKNIKKTRKNEIKGGVKQIVVSTQKENIYLQENETKIKICVHAKITDTKKFAPERNTTQKENFSRKNKIIIFNDNVMKVSWESWHAIMKIKNGYKCNLCQRDLKSSDIDVHCESEWHRYGLDKPFEKQYAPALIRKINESTLNCVFCNTEVSNKEHLVQEHINGKKHAKNYDAILKDSSRANTYTDCHDDVLIL